MEINTNCVRYELPKVRVICDSGINSSTVFFSYGLSLNFLHKIIQAVAPNLGSIKVWSRNEIIWKLILIASDMNCPRFELYAILELTLQQFFFSYGLSLNSLHSSYERNLACVAGGIVRARKVLAEELRIREENGEEVLLAAKPLKVSHAQQ